MLSRGRFLCWEQGEVPTPLWAHWAPTCPWVCNGRRNLQSAGPEYGISADFLNHVLRMQLIVQWHFACWKQARNHEKKWNSSGTASQLRSIRWLWVGNVVWREGLLEDSDDEGMAGSHVDEAIVRAGEELLVLQRGEVLDNETVHEGSMHRCPLCPFRQVSRPSRVMGHVQEYHTTKRQFCGSEAKQVRVIQALTMTSSVICGQVLATSAGVRCCVANIKWESWEHQSSWSSITIGLDGEGPGVQKFATSCSERRSVQSGQELALHARCWLATRTWSKHLAWSR